jgi:hypothetical protein
LYERLADGWRRDVLDRGDMSAGAFITLGWAAIYGFCVLRVVEILAGV